MAHTPLKALPQQERKRLGGRRGGDLPHAKGASEAFYYDGDGEPPLPDGTPISIWNVFEHPPGTFDGYWIARVSSPATWIMPCVFRTRKGNPVPRHVDPDKDLKRGAAALERGAKAIEGLTAQLAHTTSVLEGIDTRLSYLAAQVELSRKDNAP